MLYCDAATNQEEGENVESRLMLIDGQWVASSDGATRESTNPATGEVLGSYPMATKDDVDRALAAAQEGKRVWAGLSHEERKSVILRAAELFEFYQEELAGMVTAEMGKPIGMAMSEAAEIPTLLRLSVSAADMQAGEVVRDQNAKNGALGDLAFTKIEPLGVVVCIGPFNFPISTLTFKTAPALVTGNAVIIKAPSDVSLTVLRYTEILNEAGFPAGVVQALSGPGSKMGDWLVANDCIDAVSFTGSTGVGSRLVELSAPYFHHLLLEMGGNDPLIITEDANLDCAVAQSLCRMANAGQICCITKRFIVHNSIKDAYIEGLKRSIEDIKVGNPADSDTMMGCLVSEKAAKEVIGQIEEMVALGAELVCGGSRHGAFVEPTILDCERDMPIAKDLEVFGPVWSVIGFDSDNEAVSIANQSVYGLNGGVISGSLERSMSIASRIESGTVVCNGEGSYRNPKHCFGGYKRSGVGREGISDLMNEFTQRKTLVIRNIR